MIQPFFIFSDLAFFALRLVLGIVGIRHGISNLSDHERQNAKICKALAYADIVFGLCLLTGFLTQITSLFFIFRFAGDIISGYKKNNLERKEFFILAITGMFVLLTVGGGLFSADKIFRILVY